MLTAILLLVSLAAAFPWAACSGCNAPLKPEITVFSGVIPLIFLVEGLVLPTRAMAVSAARVHIHAAILAFNFLLIPAIAYAVSYLLVDWGIDWSGQLAEGLIALSAVPTTTSMSVMHSTLAGANNDQWSGVQTRCLSAAIFI